MCVDGRAAAKSFRHFHPVVAYYNNYLYNMESRSGPKKTRTQHCLMIIILQSYYNIMCVYCSIVLCVCVYSLR